MLTVNQPAEPTVKVVLREPLADTTVGLYRTEADICRTGEWGTMGVAALITWTGAVLAGMYMAAVWLIENDVSGPGAAPSRLPAPVVFAHLLLAITGLVLWAGYLLSDRDNLGWAALGALGLIAVLGFTMFARWIPVYRGPGIAASDGTIAIPAEGNFPAVIVFAHGLLAVTTLTLVVLTMLGLAGGAS